MSEIALFKSADAIVPAYLKTGELDDMTKSLMGNNNSKRISIKGGVFRMVVGGKEIAKSDDRFINVIFVNVAPKNGRTYYEGTFDPKAEAATPPLCWSADGENPASDVKAPISSKCATCPQNIKGSGGNGGRACRYHRRTAMVLENDIDGDVFALQMPAASVFGDDQKKMGLQMYAKFLGGHGVTVNSVVTEMRFDTDAESPKLMFSAVRPLRQDEYDKVVALKSHPDAVAAITLTVSQLDGVKAAPAAAETPQPLYKSQDKVTAPHQKAAFQVEAKGAEEPTKRSDSTTVAATPTDAKAILAAWADDDN